MRLAYTLLARDEGGLYKVLPMKAHLAMDVAGGAMLCALPFADGDGVCCALGALGHRSGPAD